MSIGKHLINLPSAIENSNWNTKIEFLYNQQLSSWTMAFNHYSQLSTIEKRSIKFDGFSVDIQYNPARARSTCADLKKETIEKRPCFLCSDNLPSEQLGYSIIDKYLLLINPFPIFQRHLTISDFAHIPQKIENRIIDMLSIAKELTDFTIFYNGPRCGASAPDHFHFQAAHKGNMPIEFDLNNLPNEQLFTGEDISIYRLPDYLREALVFESNYMEPIDYFFAKTIEQLPPDKEWNEPMMNLLANYQDGKFRLILFPREAQRSSHFFKSENEKVTISPASVEMAGLLITPVEKDFQTLTPAIVTEIFLEVSFTKFEPNY